MPEETQIREVRLPIQTVELAEGLGRAAGLRAEDALSLLLALGMLKDGLLVLSAPTAPVDPGPTVHAEPTSANRPLVEAANRIVAIEDQKSVLLGLNRDFSDRVVAAEALLGDKTRELETAKEDWRSLKAHCLKISRQLGNVRGNVKDAFWVVEQSSITPPQELMTGMDGVNLPDLMRWVVASGLEAASAERERIIGLLSRPLGEGAAAVISVDQCYRNQTAYSAVGLRKILAPAEVKP